MAQLNSDTVKIYSDLGMISTGYQKLIFVFCVYGYATVFSTRREFFA
jgi:hypothetical protein